MNNISDFDSFGHKTFWMVHCRWWPNFYSYRLKAFGSENCPKSSCFDKIWNIKCTLMKRTDLLSVKTLVIYPFEKPNCELFGALC